jgi:ubiquinone/menaquinone biosynthesis C-methylase UbiE
MENDLRNRGSAVSYDAYATSAMDPWDDLLINRVIHLAAPMGKTGVIVDVGSGTAVIPTKMALRPEFAGFCFLVLDLYEDMLAAARRRVAQTGLTDRIAVEQGDAHALPMVDGSADILINRATLHHLSKPVRAFREAYRVLRHGAVAVIHDIRRDVPAEVLTRFAAMRAEAGYPPTRLEEKYTVDEVRSMILEAGLAADAVVSGADHGLAALGYEVVIRRLGGARSATE